MQIAAVKGQAAAMVSSLAGPANLVTSGTLDSSFGLNLSDAKWPRFLRVDEYPSLGECTCTRIAFHDRQEQQQAEEEEP